MIPDWILWWRFTHPELFMGYVSLLLADLLSLVTWVVWEASGSASACKINSDDGFIEWEWEL